MKEEAKLSRVGRGLNDADDEGSSRKARGLKVAKAFNLDHKTFDEIKKYSNRRTKKKLKTAEKHIRRFLNSEQDAEMEQEHKFLLEKLGAIDKKYGNRQTNPRIDKKPESAKEFRINEKSEIRRNI